MVNAALKTQVRNRYENNRADYPRTCTCLRETFAEFTNEDPAQGDLKSGRDAADCFPELNPVTVIDAWQRAVRCWKTGHYEGAKAAARAAAHPRRFPSEPDDEED